VPHGAQQLLQAPDVLRRRSISTEHRRRLQNDIPISVELRVNARAMLGI
jgi:hypothetical protein